LRSKGRVSVRFGMGHEGMDDGGDAYDECSEIPKFDADRRAYM
jgi:hypothetical protein